MKIPAAHDHAILPVPLPITMQFAILQGANCLERAVRVEIASLRKACSFWLSCLLVGFDLYGSLSH